MACSGIWQNRLISVFLFFFFCVVSAGNFFQDFDIKYGSDRIKILNGGQLVTLSMDQGSGSGLQSKNEYLFGKIDMQIKLVPGNSAGTVSTFYLSSDGPNHDEIDFEFLGNLSGDPYTLHTNVFTNGKGDREQQFRLWFDPTADFHTYSILWNPHIIIFYVDGTPIRYFKNNEAKGIPFASRQPMKLYATIWNGDWWATRGGRVKIDWSKAPFTVSYSNYNANACVRSNGISKCPLGGASWYNQGLDPATLQKIKSVQRSGMIANYCTDVWRFPNGFPPECSLM